MSTTLFKKIDYSLDKLILDIDQGEIGLPDIQRPFIWEAARVRDLFDSMYKGFPVGYLLFWANNHLSGTRQIGSGQHQAKIPRLLIVDGQQRLTSLYSVLKGQPVYNRDYKQVNIKIAFNPVEERFEVTDAAIERDPVFITDISNLWDTNTTRTKFVRTYITRLRQSRPVSEDEADNLSEKIDRLFDLQKYPFTAMEISSTVNEEQVSDIFVRINSKGVALKQADFILTLMSVFWDQGRAALETFSRQSRLLPVDNTPSPFNHYISPEPDQLLRVSVGLGFRRARLQHVYSILRGKDLDTGQFSDDRRADQFEILKTAQAEALNLNNWHEFIKAIRQAGYRKSAVISSETGILYAYILFLIGKIDFKVEYSRLRNLIARWYFMVALTARYSSSGETRMEQDLADLRGLTTTDEFVAKLEQVIKDTLTEDYWNINMVNSLESSSARTPELFAFYAALILLDANVLFSTHQKVYDLLDPTIVSKRSSTERHHLFPKAYLKKNGIIEDRNINQLANFALLEWLDNNAVSDEAPASYFPRFSARFAASDLQNMMDLHALPQGWEQMDYYDFLKERRKLMAQVTRRGFEKLPS